MCDYVNCKKIPEVLEGDLKLLPGSYKVPRKQPIIKNNSNEVYALVKEENTLTFEKYLRFQGFNYLLNFFA